MSAVITPVADDVFAALGAFIQSIIGSTFPVVRGTTNRVPMPPSTPGFAVMTAIHQDRLATNVDTYVDPYPATGQIQNIQSSLQINVQVDFYGAASAAWAATFVTLFRDEYGCTALGPKCQPLYADDALMFPLVDGEEQSEERWLVTAALQYNPVVTTPEQFAAAATVVLINVDEAYPP